MKQSAATNKIFEINKTRVIPTIIISIIIYLSIKNLNNYIYIELADKNGKPVEYYIEIAHEPTTNLMDYTDLNIYNTQKITHKHFIYGIKETDRMNIYINKYNLPLSLTLKGKVNGLTFDYTRELKTTDTINRTISDEIYNESAPETEFLYLIRWHKELTVKKYIVLNLQGSIYSRSMKILQSTND